MKKAWVIAAFLSLGLAVIGAYYGHPWMAAIFGFAAGTYARDLE